MVFVVNADKRPLSPCTERRARILIRRKAARIHRMYPFTIRLVEQKNVETVEPLTLKIDPGSHETGMALVKEASPTYATELHRGGSLLSSPAKTGEGTMGFQCAI